VAAVGLRQGWAEDFSCPRPDIDENRAGTAQAMANGDVNVCDFHSFVHAGADFVLTIGQLESKGTIASG
jgi:hypothetical protein